MDSSLQGRGPSRAEMQAYRIHGHAIVSADGMIADATGTMPAALRNDADWAHFQTQLDLSQLVLVGRGSHEAAPSTGRRRRVVMSRSTTGLEQRDGVWWWNPGAVSLPHLLNRLLPDGGCVAVPGGQAVFDLLAGWRAFDEFHLSCALGVQLPGGHPAFSAQGAGHTLAEVLRQQGLGPGPALTLDEQAGVVLQVWSRQAGPVADSAGPAAQPGFVPPASGGQAR